MTPTKTRKTCSNPGCEKHIRSDHGFCNEHSRRAKHLGLIGPRTPCPSESCKFFVAKKNLCLNCYEREARKTPKKKAYEKEFRAEYMTPERKAEVRDHKRERNRETGYYQQPEYKAKKKAYYTSDHGRMLYRIRSAARRAKQELVTPPWADLEAIKQFYLKCPPGHHIDHIHPINGEHLTGLHVLENLQYLPAKENIQKSNRVDLEEVNNVERQRLLKTIT